MTENLRVKLQKTWASQLNAVQFEEYLAFYEKFPKEFAERDKMIQQINNNELGDPNGPDGERVALFMSQLAKKMKATFARSGLSIRPDPVLTLNDQAVKFWQAKPTPFIFTIETMPYFR